MSHPLLICTDLDRTLIPNGPQSESRSARARFRQFAARTEITLAYVSGRDRALVEKAIDHYELPQPDFVIGDVGSTLYQIGPTGQWQPQSDWAATIAQDWNGHQHEDLKNALVGLSLLRLQERRKQNTHKLSYFVPLHCDRAELSAAIQQRLDRLGARCNLIWSIDEPQGIGLLDILPASASKYHAICALQQQAGFDNTNTVFSGDSGNDLEVLCSPIPATLVANAEPQIKQQASALAEQAGYAAQLYLAQGNFHRLNGNYAAGILEGIAHYHPLSQSLMGFDQENSPA